MEHVLPVHVKFFPLGSVKPVESVTVKNYTCNVFTISTHFPLLEV